MNPYLDILETHQDTFYVSSAGASKKVNDLPDGVVGAANQGGKLLGVGNANAPSTFWSDGEPFLIMLSSYLTIGWLICWWLRNWRFSVFSEMWISQQITHSMRSLLLRSLCSQLVQQPTCGGRAHGWAEKMAGPWVVALTGPVVAADASWVLFERCRLQSSILQKRSAYAQVCTPTFFQRVDVLLPSEGQFVGSWTRVMCVGQESPTGMLRGRDTMLVAGTLCP